MSDWAWFHNKSPTLKPKNYHEIARNKTKSKEFILQNPKFLFEVVDHIKDCMCTYATCDCEYTDVTFFDLIIEYKTLTENDLLELGESTTLDWFKISSKVPLSNSTLLQYKDDNDLPKFNWTFISKSSLYEKNAEFIKLFHKQIRWSYVNKLQLDKNEAFQLCASCILPLNIAIKHRTMSTSQLRLIFDNLIQYSRSHPKTKTNINPQSSKIQESNSIFSQTFLENTVVTLSNCIQVLITTYNIKEVEEIYDTETFPDEFFVYADLILNQCKAYGHLPKHTEIFKHVVNFTAWAFFLRFCNPTQDYIEKHLIDLIDTEGWYYLSKGEITLSTEFVLQHMEKMNFYNLIKWLPFKDLDLSTFEKYNVPMDVISKVKLTPEYIDQNAEKLDWYSVCEYSEIPDYLLRKYINKVNWGQISSYQALSPEFIKDYANRLNKIKLQDNPRLSSQAKDIINDYWS